MKHLQATVAALVIGAMAVCLYLIVHAGNALNEGAGPTWMAAGPDGRLYVASHGSMHVFAADGRREFAVALEPLGVTRTPSDIAVRRDGRVLIADPRPRLAVCDLARRACDGRDLALRGWTPEFLVPGNSFKFALDETRNRIYISDNAGHGLVIADGDGKFIARTPKGSRAVHYPNQVLADVPGEMTLADTNHHRVVTFDVSQDRIGKVMRQFTIDAPGIARAGREWPFGIARANGDAMWVAVARDGMKDADLILYSGLGKPIKRLDLGETSDPWAIVRWGSRIAVADAREPSLRSFDPDGGDLRDIPDADFQRELGALRDEAQRWVHYRQAAIAGIVLFPLLGIFALWRLGVPLVAPARQPIARPATAAPSIAPGDIRWVGVDEKFMKRQRRAFPLILVAALAAVAMPAILTSLRPPDSLNRLFMVVMMVPGLLLVAVAFVIRDVIRKMGANKLGASAQGLHFVLMSQLSGRVAGGGPVAWSDVYFDGRRLLAGARSVQVKMPAGYEMFPRAALEAEILTRVPAANFISAGALSSKAFARMPGREKAVIVLMFAVLIGLLLLNYLVKSSW